MKKTTLTLFAVIISISCIAQRSYQEAITKADEAFKNEDYKRAYELYWSAEAFDLTKKDIVRKKINNVFDKINNLRAEAEEAKQLALKNEEKATKSDHQAELMRKNAEFAREIATENEEKATRNETEAIKSAQLSSFFISLSFQFIKDKELLIDFFHWVEEQDLKEQLDKALKIFAERSRSFENEEERSNTIALIGIMTDEQKIKFIKIMADEMAQRQFIEWKYEAKMDSIKYAYLHKWIKEGYIISANEPSQEDELDTKLPESSYEGGLNSYEKDYLIKLIYAKNNEPDNYSTWFDLSWASLLVNKPEVAIYAAKKTLELNPNAQGVETNLALGYLLTNNWEKAEQIYKKWKGKPFPDLKEKLSDFYFLTDIADLEKAGISHPDFKKVRTFFLN